MTAFCGFGPDSDVLVINNGIGEYIVGTLKEMTHSLKPDQALDLIKKYKDQGLRVPKSVVRGLEQALWEEKTGEY